MVDHYFEARDYLVRTVGKGSPWYEQHKVDDLIAEWDRFTSAPNLALNFVAQLTGMKLFTDRFLKS
jgi:hypothetical protein